ncbi:MAG: hypothetical protein M3H12_09335, partial [Chromatiales bacterium]
VEGVQCIKDCELGVIVANPGPEVVSIPAAARMLTVQEVAVIDQVVISQTLDTCEISIEQVMVENGGEQSPLTPDSNDHDPPDGQVFLLPDGTEYSLPPDSS